MGQVLLNGQDIYSIDYSQYMSTISVIFQDSQLFAFSVYDNIVLNNEFIPDKFRNVLKLSDLEDKIAQLYPKKEHPCIYKGI